MLKTKIPAFTLQEMIVVMLLTSILVSMVYYALRFLQSDVSRLRTKSAHQTEEMLFFGQLQRDIDACNQIEVRPNEIRITTENAIIKYMANDSNVVRQHAGFGINKSSELAFDIATIIEDDLGNNENQMRFIVKSDQLVEDTFYVELLPSTKRKLATPLHQTDSIKKQQWP